MIGGIGARDVVFELAFDVAKQRRRPEPEEIRLQPTVAEFLFHQAQVDQRVLGLGYAPCRL